MAASEDKLLQIADGLRAFGYSEGQVERVVGGVRDAEDMGMDVFIGSEAKSRTVPDAMKNYLTGAGSLGSAHIPSMKFAERDMDSGRDMTELNEALGIERSEAPLGPALPGAIDIKVRRQGGGFDESDETMQALHGAMRSRGLHPAVLEDKMVSGKGRSDPFHFEFGSGFGGAESDFTPYEREMSRRGLYAKGGGGSGHPLAGMRGKYKGQPAASESFVESFLRANPTASSKAADAAVTAALQEKSSKLTQSVMRPVEPHDASTARPLRDTMGALQSLADLGYEDEVYEHMTTSQEPQ